MKNVKEVTLQISGMMVAFCYGSKSYSKYVKKKTNEKCTVGDKAGESIVLTYDNGYRMYVIYVSDDISNPYFAKSTLVHEIVHTVTKVMRRLSIDDDEFRAYLTDYLYITFVRYLDSIIEKK